ncbi:DUF3021 domain-containing protein [Levilactobacillus brevis]|uniref:DUF3021 domain-containing protein n=1 Tax=Levilactobacillus brevis TaxID=1580 RepID=UPI0021A4E58A|nr:DUF3021 domain-containing protein [Levilactobacillus brevis]MCT3573703.1 DUF3021 domain-containing protein [Levilactobacillus brevis]
MKRLGILTSGVFLGLSIGFLCALCFSLIYLAPTFMPSSPAFVTRFSSNTMATLVAAGLWATIGLLFGLTSLIFLNEHWSIARQTIWHFGLSYLGFTPLAILAGWFPLNVTWLLLYTLIFVGIYLVIWTYSMLRARKTVRHLNDVLPHRHTD